MAFRIERQDNDKKPAISWRYYFMEPTGSKNNEKKMVKNH